MNKVTQLGPDGTTQLPDWVVANLGVAPGDLLEFEQQGDSIFVRRKTRNVRALVAKHAREKIILISKSKLNQKIAQARRI